MKKNKTKNKIIFLLIVLFFAFSFLQPALAQYQNQEKIPGAEKQQTEFVPYLQDIIKFGFAVIGILALFMLVIGAYQYLIASGTGNVSGAKETIASALLGLILGVCAYIILQKINPDLVNMRGITKIQGTGGNAPGGGAGNPADSGGGDQPSGKPVSSKATCDNLNSELNKAILQADNGVPPSLLAAFMQRECAAAMANPNACSGMNSQGLAGGPMQFTPATWNGLGCAGNMNNRQDALNCAAKKIAQDSGGDYSEAGILKAAKKYCGACVHANCGNDDYCQGVLANYNVYRNCPIAVVNKLFALK